MVKGFINFLTKRVYAYVLNIIKWASLDAFY